MGFLLWAALTGLALSAGAAAALRFEKELRACELLVATCVTATAMVLAAILATGFLEVLYPWTVGGGVALEAAAIHLWTRTPRETWRRAAIRFRAATRDAVWSAPSAALTLVALGLVGFLGLYAYLLPSWGWDAMWYHDPISAYAYQEHSLRTVATWIPFINSYPKNVELLALWNALFTPDDRLLDCAQLPLVVTGVVALAATCRRAGASASLAWGLGLLWLLMPAVWLNTPSNYVDAGAASLWLCAVCFLCRLDATRAHRLFGALSLGLYAGAKVSGLLHTLMLAPIVLVAVALEARRTKAWKPLALQAVAAVLAILALGGQSYVRDLVTFGNPFWPAQVPIPLLGRSFPGTWKITDFNTPPFGGPDDFAAMWRSFNTTTIGQPGSPAWGVDVRLAGFGPLWLWVLLPLAGLAVALGLVELARRRAVPGALAVAVLMITAYATPAKWWPRYTMGFPAAGLLGAAILLSRLPRAWLQQGALALVGAWACVQAWPARVGLLAPRDKERPNAIFEVVAHAWSAPPGERAVTKLDNWIHTADRVRDQVIAPGDAAAYDNSTSFVYQLWRSDWHNRVLYLPLERVDQAGEWLARLGREHVRWASVQRGSIAERALRGAGWKEVQLCESESCGVWVPADAAAALQPR